MFGIWICGFCVNVCKEIWEEVKNLDGVTLFRKKKWEEGKNICCEIHAFS